MHFLQPLPLPPQKKHMTHDRQTPLIGVASASRFRRPPRSRCFVARFPAVHRLNEDGLKMAVLFFLGGESNLYIGTPYNGGVEISYVYVYIRPYYKVDEFNRDSL